MHIKNTMADKGRGDERVVGSGSLSLFLTFLLFLTSQEWGRFHPWKHENNCSITANVKNCVISKVTVKRGLENRF